MVQLSHPHMTTGETVALTRWTFVDKAMSLLFNMLSRWVITFLPRSKHLLISWLQSPSAVILEPRKIKSLTVSIVSPSICHEVMGPDGMIFFFECWVLTQLFHSPLSLSSRGSLVLLHFLPRGGVISYLRLLNPVLANIILLIFSNHLKIQKPFLALSPTNIGGKQVWPLGCSLVTLVIDKTCSGISTTLLISRNTGSNWE